jgi:hypothetical protein
MPIKTPETPAEEQAMTTEAVEPTMTAIEQAQAELERLLEEELDLPRLRGAKQTELDEARFNGDSQRAVLLVEDLAYLSGPRMEHIWQLRLEAQAALRDVLVTTLEASADEWAAPLPEQLERETKAKERLERVSGCQWQPKVDTGESMGRAYRISQRPVSARWQAEVEYRRNLANRLRGLQPSRGNSLLTDVCREGLRVINNNEKPE